MAYPTPSALSLPITPYKVNGYRFGQRLRRRIILWATHLGDDVVAKAGSTITAIGEGEVVWSEIRRGSVKHRNWGGVIIVGHTHRKTGQPFYSVYGHMRDLGATVGDVVTAGQTLGVIAESSTPENGWWIHPHLHFGIYTGPWNEQILPGYKRPEERRTKMAWWQDPQLFITEYNKAS